MDGLDRASLDPWFAKMEQRLNIEKWIAPPNNNDVLKRGRDAKGWHVDDPRNERLPEHGYCGMAARPMPRCPCWSPPFRKRSTTRHLIHSAQAHQLVIEGDTVTGVIVHPLQNDKSPLAPRSP